jgi:hypothetical protein
MTEATLAAQLSALVTRLEAVVEGLRQGVLRAEPTVPGGRASPRPDARAPRDAGPTRLQPARPAQGPDEAEWT